jgi:hypothetical protein
MNARSHGCPDKAFTNRDSDCPVMRKKSDLQLIHSGFPKNSENFFF